MAIGIANATQSNGVNHFEVCPTWVGGACACPRTADGHLVTPHPTFDFGATPPPPPLTVPPTAPETAAAYATRCATEALRLVAAHQAAAAPAAAPLAGIAGLVI